ncbi:MAG: hypothetical protein K8F52_11105 [Candidatus Scalindua rubra]|uniref:Uncharacterized protein n=1 Tax=Candidatus Scalindua brodae TaxID=237368 RepID=A0A0B0EIS2_9BACT|nr:MAG: hypothetical protein SCABRO_02343 [Candidatus Scalindua brodae]MBZ0109208.1 hypothetical protein [Candidatus Scalindua rubra]
MIDRKEKHRMYASLINEDQKKIIGTVDKAIVAKQHQGSSIELE